MKKQILISILFLVVKTTFGQIVFCPPGAKWHFSNKSGADSFPWEKSEAVKYERDTLVDGVSAMVLSHSSFFAENVSPCKLTLIKQVGDTVFLRNQITQNTWQILYNFNATIGQSWYNVLLPTNSAGGTVYSFTTTVDSVKVVTVNGINLKRLFVKNYNSAAGSVARSAIITERFGAEPFLFYWIIFSHFQINYFSGLLCYEDSNWPLQQFTNKACSYSNIMGVDESGFVSEKVKISPNPVVDFLNIEWEYFNEQMNVEVIVLDINGKKVKETRIKQGEKIVMSDLSKGIYLLQLRSDNKSIYTGKVLKQ